MWVHVHVHVHVQDTQKCSSIIQHKTQHKWADPSFGALVYPLCMLVNATLYVHQVTYSFFSYNRFCSLNRSNNRPPPSAPPIARLRRRNLGERWCHLPRFGIRDELHLASLSLSLQRIECGALDTLVPDHRALSIVTHRHFWILPIQRLIPLLSQYKCKRRVATLFPGAMGMLC